MSAHQLLLIAAASLIIVTLAIHSLLGERRLIRPMLASRHGVLESGYARSVVRFAWHFTSVLGAIGAAALLAEAIAPAHTGTVVIAATGIGFLASGLIDAVVTRGRHIGWPFLTVAGLLTLLALKW